MPNNTSTETLEDALRRGLEYARVRDWLHAIEAYRKAVAIDPESVEARFRLGWSLWNDAEGDKPGFGDMAFAYGAQVLGLGSPAKEGKRKFQRYRQSLLDAEYYLRTVLEREPNHARATHYLAQSLNALDRRTEATDLAKRAAQLDPANTNYATLANALNTPQTTQVKPDNISGGATWDDIILPPKTKRELRQMQLMLEKPDMARELGIQPPTGILLKGPPGTGKTTVARILANEAKCSFFSITPADVQQMYVGESEKRVRDLFLKARQTAPSIIFIDEIDALLTVRQGGVAIHSDKIVNQFLQEMDGLSSNNRVFVVGATNRPDMLDPAVRRGGRLSREIEIPLPDLEARKALFELCTRITRLAQDVDLEKLAEDTNGYSGADIRALVNEAGLQALIRIADSSETNLPRTLGMEDFASALSNLG
ncbi:MAG: AAA family ATPase [Armatimonadetes bacterium]|nr:AAA family ATPase [Armatimonadota bacterium]